MARTIKATPTYNADEAEIEAPHPTRRRIQVRRPEEMVGLSVSILVPNAYNKALMRAFFEDEGATPEGRKSIGATMVRRILIKGLAELTGDTEDEVAEALAVAEAEEAESIQQHRERHRQRHGF